MKQAFSKKIQELNEEINDIKVDSRRKINNLNEDLNQVTYVKDLFLRQVTDLQKKFKE
jgi:hypothetical protein